MARSKSKKYFTQEKTLVDSETGEVITSSKSYTVKTNIDTFYMSFIGAMSGFYSLKSIVDVKVIAALCERAQMDTGRVDISPDERADIAEALGVSVQQVTNSIAALKKKQLISGSRGFYQLNPSVFWRGSLASRDEILKSGGLSFTVNFEADNEE